MFKICLKYLSLAKMFYCVHCFGKQINKSYVQIKKSMWYYSCRGRGGSSAGPVHLTVG